VYVLVYLTICILFVCAGIAVGFVYFNVDLYVFLHAYACVYVYM